MTLLEVDGLSVDLVRPGRRLRLVEDVSLHVGAGEAVGLVGESGSGKSVTAFAVLGLFPAPGMAVTAGTVRLDGTDLRMLAPHELRRVRGRRVGMVFQDPSAYLDPLMTVGRQVAEALRAHGLPAGPARVAALLDAVELPDPARLARRHPHELSGGQRQRVLIAAALAPGPALLIADEPTTALDVTVQAGILALLDRLRRERGLGILLITHDLGVVAQHCARVAVMYAGGIVETAPARDLFARPRHPYTAGLLRATDAARLFSIPGRVPGADAMPTGCRFHPRCPLALPDPCVAHAPALRPNEAGADACWRSAERVDPWPVIPAGHALAHPAGDGADQ